MEKSHFSISQWQVSKWKRSCFPTKNILLNNFWWETMLVRKSQAIQQYECPSNVKVSYLPTSKFTFSLLFYNWCSADSFWALYTCVFWVRSEHLPNHFNSLFETGHMKNFYVFLAFGKEQLSGFGISVCVLGGCHVYFLHTCVLLLR